MKAQELIPITEVPQHLPVSLPTVRFWVMQEKVPVIRIGRRIFLKREVVERIAQEGTDELFAEMEAGR
jgi:hypothetical protein